MMGSSSSFRSGCPLLFPLLRQVRPSLQRLTRHLAPPRMAAERPTKLTREPQRGYDEPAILSYAISSFCPTSADGLQSPNWGLQRPCRIKRLRANFQLLFAVDRPARRQPPLGRRSLAPSLPAGLGRPISALSGANDS